MSKKLLNEAAVRRFMGLAGMQADMVSNTINEMGYKAYEEEEEALQWDCQLLECLAECVRRATLLHLRNESYSACNALLYDQAPFAYAC